MESIAIFPITNASGSPMFHAVAKAGQSEGRTPGEALDGLGMAPAEGGTIVVIQSFRPDDIFGEKVRARLEELMARWRSARDAGCDLPQTEKDELESLTEAELLAATVRSRQMIQRLGG